MKFRIVFAMIVATAAILPASAQDRPASRPAAESRPSVPEVIKIPGWTGALEFDDLCFAKDMNRIVLPAAASGKIALVDPESRAVETIDGFGSPAADGRGTEGGSTSADEGGGRLFAIDHGTPSKVVVIDSKSRKIVASAATAAEPDFVRWIEETGELWVTEPEIAKIEIFTIAKIGDPAPKKAGEIDVPGGPESLIVDHRRKRVHTHLWRKSTVAIDISSRRIVASFENGFRASRGIALDPERGHLFAASADGEVVVFDLAKDGHVLSRLTVSAGVDIIDYDAKLHRLYVPSEAEALIAVVDVTAAGILKYAGAIPTAAGCSAVAIGGTRRLFLPDPSRGVLLFTTDPFPAFRE